MASVESIATSNGYDLIRKTLDLFEGVELWEAKGSRDFAPYWVLCIPKEHSQHSDAYGRAISRLPALRNEPSLLPCVANYGDDEHLCLVYERSDEWVPLQYLRQEDGTHPLWVMRATAELLESFYRRRLSGHFAGAGAIFVDERRQAVRLAFMGLADIFSALEVMSSGSQGRRSWLDDVYDLAQAFSQQLEQIGNETISSCQSPDPSDRPEYRELFKAMREYEDFHPQYEYEEEAMSSLDSNESTAENSGYDLIRKSLDVFEGVELWEAEDSREFEPCWVLRIPNRRTQHPAAYSAALSRLSALRNQPSLLPWLADYEEGGHLCLVYEKSEEWVPLEHISQRDGSYPLWVMREAVKLLENFYRRRLSGHFAGAGAIFVDEQHHEVRLAFMGLADIFTALEVMPSGSRGRRSWLDDVYELGQTFSQELRGLGDETISRCLSPDPSDRPGYQELSKAMQNHEDFHPQYRDVKPIPLSFMKGEKAPAHGEIEELLHCLNTNDCFTTPWEVNEKEKEKGKEQRSCDFQAGEFVGRFSNEIGTASFFVPYFHRNGRKISGEVLKARFEYSSEEVLNDDVNKHHHLTQQRDSRMEKLDEWKRVPEQEKEHLEENAFKERYIHIQELTRDGDKIPKLSFLLEEDKASRGDLKTRIDEMWEHSRTLEAVDFKAKVESSGNSSDAQAVNVGYVFDAPEQPRLVIGLKNLGGEVPQRDQAGTLILDGGLADLDYEFCWRSGGLFYFAVSRDHDHESEEIHREISELLQHSESNTEVLIEPGLNVKGRLYSVKTCHEVVMRDFKDKPGGYPGELYEDVSRETVPLRRQIEAVEDFGRREMVEPGFESVLLNPGGHLPQIVSLTPSEAENETPEDGYSLFQDDDDCGAGDPDPDSYFSKSAGAKSEGTRLDENQEKAVQGALAQKPVFLIHGPPGTGKTTVIEEIIRRILTGDDRKRILVCSQTNLAVDNVLERLGRSEKAGIRPVRLAADENKIDQPVRPLWLDKSLQSWGKDKINRSNQYFKGLQERSPEKAHKIERILKKYHQFLREAGTPSRKDQCRIRGYDGYGLESFEEAFLRSRNVIGATCVHMAAARYRSLFKGTFDFVIMDEASKATPAESLIPILRAKRAILIGDHKQLPPFVTTDRDVLEKVRADSPEELEYPDETLRRRYGKSLFEILIDNFQKPEQERLQQMLKVQRRMPKQIGDLISRHFYDGELASDGELDKKKTANPPLRFRRPTSIVFVDTSRHKDRHDNGKSTSRQNRCNARVIEEVLKTLNNTLREEKDIAVIAGYRSQVGLLRDRIRRLKPAQNLRRFKGGIEPNTVDGFQGKENDIVIFDVVRSATGGKIGFLDDRRRLNVSLSRARELLIIVGDFEFLSKKAGPIPDPDIPGDRERKKPLLGLIADEIEEQGFVFDSLEEALQ